MIITLVKNNFKLIFREKIYILFMIFLPIVLVSLLSAEFSKYMDEDPEMKDVTIGYSINEASTVYPQFDTIKESMEDNHIILEKSSLDEALDLIEDNKMESFVEFNDNQYVIHKSTTDSLEETVFEGILSTILSQYNNYGFAVMNDFEPNMNGNNLKVKEIDTEPVPSSTNYYGIAEIVFIIYCGMLMPVTLNTWERKNNLKQRIAITNASKVSLLFGKLIPSILMILLQVGIASLYCTYKMHVSWGNHLALSMFIIFLETSAVSAVGLLLSMVVKKNLLSNVLVFVSGFFFGFIGGSFQTYMYNTVGETLPKYSPIYYINRTLIEFSTKGTSDYTVKCITILCVIIIVSCILGCILEKREVK